MLRALSVLALVALLMFSVVPATGSSGVRASPSDPISDRPYTPPSYDPQPVDLAIPLYIYPGSAWSMVQNDSSSVGFVVMNPNSGPGSSPDPNYVQAVDATEARGILVLGYVHTSYASGAVTLAQAETWVGDYYSWYDVNGIFFDEASDVCDASTVAYYSSLYNFTKAEPGDDMVVLNPGTATGACYGPISNVILSSETNYTEYLYDYSGASWTSSYPASHFWNVVYNVPGVAQMEAVMTLANERGAGIVYVTDLKEPNPYDALPSYWATEVNLTEPLQVPAISVTPSTTLPVGQAIGLSVSASGGGWNYSYRWNGLPPGCVGSAAAVLTCTPATVGLFHLNVTVTDADGANETSPTTVLTVVAPGNPHYTVQLFVGHDQCSPLGFNGTERTNGSAVLVVPGLYEANVTACAGFIFDEWNYTPEGSVTQVYTTAWLNLSIDSNGTLTADFYPDRGPGTWVSVPFNVYPAQCGPVFFNGSKVANGSTITATPDVEYTALAPTCTGFAFVDWVFVYAGLPLSHAYDSASTTIDLVNGSLAAFYRNLSSPIEVSLEANTTTASVGSPVTLTPSILRGTTPYSCGWFLNGTTPDGVGCSPRSLSWSHPGSYSYKVVGIDALGDENWSQGVEITVIPPPPIAFANGTITSASGSCGSGPASMTVLYSGAVRGGIPPYTFSWTFSGSSTASAGAEVTHTFASLEGEAELTVTDSRGRSAEVWLNISDVPASCGIAHDLFGLPETETLALFGVLAAALLVLASAIVLLRRRKLPPPEPAAAAVAPPPGEPPTAPPLGDRYADRVGASPSWRLLRHRNIRS